MASRIKPQQGGLGREQHELLCRELRIYSVPNWAVTQLGIELLLTPETQREVAEPKCMMPSQSRDVSLAAMPISWQHEFALGACVEVSSFLQATPAESVWRISGAR